jgi:rubrerythrin
MDATGNLSSHSGQEVDNPEPDNHSGCNTHLSFNEDLIKQEQNIVISSYGSIVGCWETWDGYNTKTISVNNGYGHETIEVDESVSIKIETVCDSQAEGVMLEPPNTIKTEVMDGYRAVTIKQEDSLDIKTEVTSDSDLGTRSYDATQKETDFRQDVDNFVDTLKTEVEPTIIASAADTDTSTNQISTKPGYVCSVCGKSFSRKHTLNVHERLHTGEKPFSCTVCGKSFAGKVKLSQHQVLHTGDKPHSCTVCGKSFTKKDHLTRHKLVHTKEKPHSCTVCGKSFSQGGELKRHNLLHTGEKPHSCTVCGKSFTRKCSLQRHKH